MSVGDDRLNPRVLALLSRRELLYTLPLLLSFLIQLCRIQIWLCDFLRRKWTTYPDMAASAHHVTGRALFRCFKNIMRTSY